MTRGEGSAPGDRTVHGSRRVPASGGKSEGDAGTGGERGSRRFHPPARMMGRRRDGGRRRQPCGGGMGGTARAREGRPAVKAAVRGGPRELQEGGGERNRRGMADDGARLCAAAAEAERRR
ncbi:Os04g0557300 [Oryza sativa Japonica Group]|uniref:Os04g0557300 protein n=1 Tax=Oryza sativa subsp. japonica TaxID=39947 RepID=A0A0P0WDC8_ORYSJ|nr:Os04g0557300 [Oryza sativa Japonica Group]